MAKCPQCKKEINHLLAEYDVIRFNKIYNDTDEQLIDYHDNFGSVSSDDNSGERFYCPDCDELLFHHRENAVKFLENKTI